MGKFPTQAIVLAAGLGTRLRPLTHRVPKPVLPVGGLPILFYNLFLLREAGVREVVINLHLLPEKIRSLLANSKGLGLKIRYSLEPKILGTAGGIAQALRKMWRVPTFVLNGDILCNVDLKGVFEKHRRSGAHATLVCLPRDRAKVKSFVETDGRLRIWRIAGGPAETHAKKKLKKWIFSGIHLLEPKIFSGYPRHSFGCIVRQVYQPALAKGRLLNAFIHRGEWWDLGSLTELSRVDRMLWADHAPRSILQLREEARAWATPSQPLI